jgi:hypothetical protein
MNLKELLAEAKRISELKCSDGFCKFAGPAKGMHTNGGCRCQADPTYLGRGPYSDLQYMANLLGLIAVELEQKQEDV